MGAMTTTSVTTLRQVRFHARVKFDPETGPIIPARGGIRAGRLGAATATAYVEDDGTLSRPSFSGDGHYLNKGGDLSKVRMAYVGGGVGLEVLPRDVRLALLDAIATQYDRLAAGDLTA